MSCHSLMLLCAEVEFNTQSKQRRLEWWACKYVKLPAKHRPTFLLLLCPVPDRLLTYSPCPLVLCPALLLHPLDSPCTSKTQSM